MEMSTRLKVFGWFKIFVLINLILINIVFRNELNSISLKSILVYTLDFFVVVLLFCINKTDINLHYSNLKWIYEKHHSNTYYAVKYILCNQLNSIAKLDDSAQREEILTGILIDMHSQENNFQVFNAFEKIGDHTRKTILDLCDKVIKEATIGKHSLEVDKANVKVFKQIKNYLDHVYI